MAMQAHHSADAFSHDLCGRPPMDSIQELKMMNYDDSRSRKRAREQSSSMVLAGVSTSGQHAAGAFSSNAFSALEQYQSHEIDAVIRLQNERLRSGLEEARKKQCRALLTLMDQNVLKRLTEKETELENTKRQNAELEEKLRHMLMESQIFFNIAKNSEALAYSLRATLDQALLQSAATCTPAVEGYGDSDDVCVREEDEAGSAVVCREEEIMNRRSCRVCRESEVCVLLLPCRHLCLCRECELKIDVCPVCKSTRNASIQIALC